MKKRMLFLLPLFLGACSNAGESPFIKIEQLFVKTSNGEIEDGSQVGNGEKKNYADRINELPVLKEGDKVDALLSLDGNGSELKTFKLQTGDEMKTELFYEKNDVSTEGNLTDEQKGQLRFKDGVTQAKVLVHATVDHVDKNGNANLIFYLSSKAECEGAQEGINLKTKKAE